MGANGGAGTVTIIEHMSSPPPPPRFFVGVCINRSLVLFVSFEDCCLSFYPFSCGHCVVCPFTDSDYLFRIVKPFLYLLVLLKTFNINLIAIK
jgi:hypothetical protein